MIKKIGVPILVIIGILIFAAKVFNLFSGGDIANQPVAVGDCVAQTSTYEHVKCDDAAAAYTITSQTDIDGTTCAETDLAIISQEYNNKIEYFCVTSAA